MDAILLLGHGSRLTEANNILREMAQLVKGMGEIPLVEFASLQFGRPDFFEGVSNCISKGARRVIIQPYLLYKGRHFDEDISEMIVKVQKRYRDIEFFLTEPLGVHREIAKIVLERVKNDVKRFEPLKPQEIEQRSLEIITEELKDKRYLEGTNFSEQERSIIKRVIHATGDFDFVWNMRFHPEAVEVGIRAIKKGMDILVDVQMVEAGINKRAIEKWGGKVICNIQKGILKKSCNFLGCNTKAEIGIEKALRENHNIGIIAIGNAPTALYRTMNLIRNNVCKPELVIGVPVGFVRAVESKEVLLHMKYPFITSLGRKGGSPVAVAIVNALLKLAEEGK